MTHDDIDPFFDCLAKLSELFHGARFSDAKAEIYFEALRDLPVESVIGAMNAAVKVCTFMPMPAELRKIAVGDDEDQAEQAWMAVRSTMRSVGAYASVVTVDAALGEAVLAVFGSWPEACHLDLSPEMWSSKRKEFGRVYRVLKDRALVGSRYLTGICEQQNAGRSEWLKHVSVAVLDGPNLKMLRGDQANEYRAQLAAAAHVVRRITDGEVLPARSKATA
jgi:hypothetical protein